MEVNLPVLDMDLISEQGSKSLGKFIAFACFIILFFRMLTNDIYVFFGRFVRQITLKFTCIKYTVIVVYLVNILISSASFKNCFSAFIYICVTCNIAHVIDLQLPGAAS